MDHNDRRRLAMEVAMWLSGYAQTDAVALAGSATSGESDSGSDIDLYAYISAEIPPSERQVWIQQRAVRAEVDNRFWETGDEWVERESGISVDVMYRGLRWMEEQIERILVRHEASVGYSTCFWFNLKTSEILFDRSGKLRALKASADQPYPEELRRAIVRKNYPILRQNISSYSRQIEKAVTRRDGVSLNHRVAAFLASYFDILFAVNRMPHPGEKRLVSICSRQCAVVPDTLEESVNRLVRSFATPGDIGPCLVRLVDGLDQVLRSEGLLELSL